MNENPFIVSFPAESEGRMNDEIVINIKTENITIDITYYGNRETLIQLHCSYKPYHVYIYILRISYY